ncbi:hypothetical protein [Salinispora sp. H7-4]|uniref:hypothetical protein n=1 Tax=Salinispora sp. H7-4 TaxID=2748321 RepID=UPI0015D13A29|nr:hypothetical protein [Salinispora sp. H7-4]NYT94616.1 hypothetical protein [Salinispora sp. H7-4]
MERFAIVESPLDVELLKAERATLDTVQFDKPLSDRDYRALAAFLEDNPDITLRAYGFDRELASLEFLRWFPDLASFSLDGLHWVDNLEGLRKLPADLRCIDVGQTQKSLDLRPLMRFKRLRKLRIQRHSKSLTELLQVNQQLQALALWNCTLDKFLGGIEFPELEALALTLGSCKSNIWLPRTEMLCYLALRGIRGVAEVGFLDELRSLQWLWLDGLAKVSRLPDLSWHPELMRVDLTEMRGLRGVDSLEPLRRVPKLEELLVTESKLPVEAFRPLVGMPSLRRVGVGLGSQRRNEEVKKLLAKPAPDSLDQFSNRVGLIYTL